MGASGRLVTRPEDSGINAPDNQGKSTAVSTDSGSQREDYKAVGAADLSIARTGTFDANSDFRDLRPDRVISVSTDAAGADTFTLTFALDADEDGTYAGTVDVDGKFTTAAIEDNDVAATIQTAIRAAVPGADTTVVTGDAPGPFLIIFDREFYSRRYPRVTGTGTGCTVTVADADYAVSDDADQVTNRGGVIGALGESHRVSETDSIIKPTIGTITVTNSTHRVDTLDFAASTAGGTFDLRAGGRVLGSADWNASVATVQALITAAVPAAERPVVTKRGTNEVQTLVLTSFDNGDTIKLTHAGTESAAVTAAAGAGVTLADFQAKADALFAITIPGYVAGACVVTETTIKVEYVFTFSGQTVIGDQTAITATSGTGSAAGVFTETTKGVHDGYVFTYPRAVPAVTQVLSLSAQALTDGSTGTKTAVFSTTTAGVLGQTSTAYTENGSGDSVLAAAVNDTTGKSYGFVADAATPVVHIGLPNGSYHMILRTVEDGRVSKADSKAFTVT